MSGRAQSAAVPKKISSPQLTFAAHRSSSFIYSKPKMSPPSYSAFRHRIFAIFTATFGLTILICPPPCGGYQKLKDILNRTDDGRAGKGEIKCCGGEIVVKDATLSRF